MIPLEAIIRAAIWEKVARVFESGVVFSLRRDASTLSEYEE